MLYLCIKYCATLRSFFTRHRILVSASAIVAVALSVWLFWLWRSFSAVHDTRSEVTLVRTDWYEIEVDGKPLLYFSAVDTSGVMVSLTEHRDSAINVTRSYGRWSNRRWWLPSSRGSIVAAMDSLPAVRMNVAESLRLQAEHVQKQLRSLNVMAREMDYFFSVHSVQDEGYMLVTSEYERTRSEAQRLGSVLMRINECLSAPRATIVRRSSYRTLRRDSGQKWVSDSCVFDGEFFRINDRKTPGGVRAISFRHRRNLGLGYIHSVVVHPLETPPDGFALRVSAEKGVQLGEWKQGRYRGERLEYNMDRIYGIDISRFQHEVGRRRYAINWKKLRITSLGTLSKKRISGRVDYPVSFCYIKSTEGTNILNRYYKADYVQSRRHGLRTGTYHFFSTKTPASKQARWFLANSRFLSGDLPPVLDVEPTDAQIARMGGAEAMFREVRVWLSAVERQWGVRPILYISQNFVNRYLPLAPDIKENYNVWIARYGEYKPDVHMVFWQLSPDGKVAGIVPKVDINVFNGYADKYKAFVSDHSH